MTEEIKLDNFELIGLFSGKGQVNPTHSFTKYLDEKNEIQTNSLLLAINNLS